MKINRKVAKILCDGINGNFREYDQGSNYASWTHYEDHNHFEGHFRDIDITVEWKNKYENNSFELRSDINFIFFTSVSSIEICDDEFCVYNGNMDLIRDGKIRGPDFIKFKLA